MAFLAFTTEPVMAASFPWWQLRSWSGQYYWVHPDGWYEELEPWEHQTIEFAFATEPAMAVYVDAVSNMVTPGQEWPPVWNADLQIWQTSRDQPERGSVAAQPLDLHALWHSQQPAGGSSWQSSSWEPGQGSSWEQGQGSSWEPGQGSSWESGQNCGQPDQGYWEPGKGWSNPTSSHPSSSSSGSTAGREPEQPWRWKPEEGWYQPYAGAKKPRPDFDAPRFGTRGFGASCRRMEKRWLERRGKDVPAHLKPAKAHMTKEVKTKMKELLKQMYDIDASSESEMAGEAPEPGKAAESDSESSSSFDFGGGGGNAKARDGSRKRVWSGTPPKLATVPEEPAVATDPKVEEEEEDEDEDMGVKKEPAEAEKEKKKKKKTRRKSKKSKKDKSDSEDPGDGPDGPPGGPGGASDGSRGPGFGPALVAAT